METLLQASAKTFEYPNLILNLFKMNVIVTYISVVMTFIAVYFRIDRFHSILHLLINTSEYKCDEN